MFALLAACKKRGNHFGEILSKVVLEDTSHNTEEEETAFSKPSTTEFNTLKALFHRVMEVRLEIFSSNSLSECASGIHGDPTEFCLLSFTSKEKELEKNFYDRLEIGKKAFLSCVCCTSYGANDN